MRLEDFLSRHGLEENPFVSAEEAQGDVVLSHILEQSNFRFGHSSWDKFCGSPPGTQTSVVFGPKGSGKTAMRLALEKSIRRHNELQPEDKVLLVPYTDFNPCLDRWKVRTDARKRAQASLWSRMIRRAVPAASLSEDWSLSHHVDAILAEVARLIPGMLRDTPLKPSRWPAHIKYDILFLAAVYLPLEAARYREAMREIRHAVISPSGRFTAKAGKILAAVGTLMLYPLWVHVRNRHYANRAANRVEVVAREGKDTAWGFRGLPGNYLRTMPLLQGRDRGADRGDHRDDTHEDRFGLLGRLVAIAACAGYARVLVVVDKVDEPMLIQGDARMMADFMDPMFNIKLLQLDGLHFKLLLPYQLNTLRRKAEARLDKANVINPLLWSGISLYEMCCERLTACGGETAARFDLQALFAPAISREDLLAQFEKLRTPRYANKFMDRVIRGTCESLPAEEHGALPRIPASVFHRVSAELEAEMRVDAQELGEIL